jgi:hypothetical protein
MSVHIRNDGNDRDAMAMDRVVDGRASIWISGYPKGKAAGKEWHVKGIESGTSGEHLLDDE